MLHDCLLEFYKVPCNEEDFLIEFLKKYSKGETICTVTSLNGKEVQEIKAPFSGGFVYDIPDSLYISKGESFIEYAKNPQELFNKA